MNGGNGIDGETLLTWLDPVEMGGTLLLEAVGVTLSPGSTGILAGFFMALETSARCIAGFQATAQAGHRSSYVAANHSRSAGGNNLCHQSANQYTLRVRVHCPENERALAIYHSFGDNGAITAGGQWNTAPGNMQMEIQEFVNGVGGTPVTLYDGALANLPGTCMVVAGQQHQSDWNHARLQPDQSWLGLGGEHAAQRRRRTRGAWARRPKRPSAIWSARARWSSIPALRRWRASRLR